MSKKSELEFMSWKPGAEKHKAYKNQTEFLFSALPPFLLLSFFMNPEPES
jgi:hypothetical protein